jgi:hypothetical protein
MATQVERAVDALFPQEGSSRVRNVKFHRGWCSSVTAEQLAGQLVSANEQIRSGSATLITDVDGDLTV